MPHSAYTASALAVLLLAATAGISAAQQTSTSTMTASTQAAAATPGAPGSLRVATWGGAYGEAQRIAVFEPFAKETGIKIDAAHGAKGPTLTGSLDWDVADLSSGDAAVACQMGLIDPIDPASLRNGPDGTPAAQDFLSGGLSKCGVASLAWSALFLVDTDRKDEKTGKSLPQPKTLQDVFDVVHFPGKRGLPRNPRYVLELALMADGVLPDYVYYQLSQPEGLARAFRRLATLRSNIVWWDDAQEGINLLKTRKVAMTLGFSGRAFSEATTGTRPIAIVWDGQIYDVDVWAVAKGARSKADAMKFVAYASSSERLADTARQFPYGPMRRSALPLVGTHAVLGTDLKPYLPTSPENLTRALRLDDTWWRAHEADLAQRLDQWIDNPPSKSGVGEGSLKIIAPPG